MANLIAAAIIYLAGVVAGVFPKSPAAIYSAAGFIGIATCFGLVILVPVMQSLDADVKVVKLVALASVIVAGSMGIVLSVTSPAGAWTKTGVAVLSVPVLALSAHTFFLVAREKRPSQ